MEEERCHQRAESAHGLRMRCRSGGGGRSGREIRRRKQKRTVRGGKAAESAGVVQWASSVSSNVC